MSQPAALTDFKWPFFQHSRYNEALTKFMYSFKNPYSPNINSYASVAFVTGPTKCGKSWFLRFNMRKFEANESKPLVLYFDMNQRKCINFQTFLSEFEAMLIGGIVSKGGVDPVALLLRFQDANVVEQHVARGLQMALEKGYSYGFEFDGDRKIVEEVLRKYRGKGFKETPIIDQIEEIANAFSNYDPFEVKLRLCYDACVRRELDAVSSGRFDHALSYTSNFRTGLDCMNYLLDVVNEIANYSEKHYDETIE